MNATISSILFELFLIFQTSEHNLGYKWICLNFQDECPEKTEVIIENFESELVMKRTKYNFVKRLLQHPVDEKTSETWQKVNNEMQNLGTQIAS